MWKITENQHGLDGARVRVKATGKLGTIKAVMPDKDGSPWSLHVKLDEQEHGDPPLILAPDECSRIDLFN